MGEEGDLPPQFEVNQLLRRNPAPVETLERPRLMGLEAGEFAIQLGDSASFLSEVRKMGEPTILY